MRRFLKLFAIAGLINAMLPLSASNGMTDEEKKQQFLKAREEMQTVEEPTPAASAAPKPKPKPATHHKETPTPTPTPVRHRQKPTEPEHKPTPEPGPTSTPAEHKKPLQTSTPRPTQPLITWPTPTPRPTPPPRPTPAPTPASTPAPTPAERSPHFVQPNPRMPVYVQKSDNEVQEPPPPPEPHGWWPWSAPVHYRFLSRSVIDAIRNAPVTRGRWRYIVVHNSGTRQGNAKIFDYYHRYTRRMPNGLAYHFVIGNGSSSGDGQIEIGDRWRRQINGGHVHSDFLNSIALGICLVGDFNRDTPTKNQLAALDELIRYLRTRCGKFEGHVAIVKAHKEINPVPTDCPGERFPYHWLHSEYDLR